ncbi:MAG TPA: AraC family transcriptional regulator [Clostridiales bacterium]|nr:AraC family transcriptional regulator [Clostridiales bacterium]
MRVKEFIDKSPFVVLTGESGMNKDIDNVYIGDLLSRVMSGAQFGSAWVTIHTHMNILAVAALNELPVIIIPEGIDVPEPVIEKAIEENIAILSADCTAYEVCRICIGILG